MEPQQSEHPAADAETSISVWLPEIAERVASFLPSNFVASTLRILDKASAEQFSDIREVQLSQPVPRWALSEHWLAPEACRSLTLDQRRQLVSLVAASGDVANLMIALKAAGCQLNPSALVAAARVGALECCKLLAGMRRCLARDWLYVLNAAAQGGDRAVCEWCLEKGAEPRWQAVGAAYYGTHPELAELLTPEGKLGPYDAEALIRGAASGCDLAFLQATWAALADRQSRSDSRCLSAAVGSPTPDWQAKAEFLLAKGVQFAHCSADYAVRLPPHTALRRLEWLKARGCPLKELTLDAVVFARNTPALQWLLAHGAKGYDYTLARDLPRLMSVDGVRMLLEAKQLFRGDLVTFAIKAGAPGLPVLRWLVDTYGAEVLDPASPGNAGGNYRRWGFDDAAESGCQETMAYVRALGGDGSDSDGRLAFSASSWEHVAGSGCEAGLEWLARMDCPMPDDGRPYAAVIRSGDARTLRVLRRLGLPWGKRSSAKRTFVSALKQGLDLDTLRWMVAEGCPVDWAAAKAEAERLLSPSDPAGGELLAWIQEAAAEQQPRAKAR